jgi:hypothetical protein
MGKGSPKGEKKAAVPFPNADGDGSALAFADVVDVNSPHPHLPPLDEGKSPLVGHAGLDIAADG